MKLVARIFLGALFSFVFALFLSLTVLRFQLLNYEFLTSTFSKHNSYAKIQPIIYAAIEDRKETMQEEELAGFRQIAANVTPQLAEEIVNTNLKEFLSYIDGETSEIMVYLPLQKLGFPPEPGQTDEIPLSMFIEDSPGNPLPHFYGAGTLIMYGWWGMLAALIVILVLQLALGLRLNTKRASIFLLMNGVPTTIGCLGVLLYLEHVSFSLSRDPDPIGKALSILTSSLFPEMVLAALYGAIAMSVVGMMLFIIYFIKKRSIHQPSVAEQLQSVNNPVPQPVTPAPAITPTPAIAQAEAVSLTPAASSTNPPPTP